MVGIHLEPISFNSGYSFCELDFLNVHCEFFMWILSAQYILTDQSIYKYGHLLTGHCWLISCFGLHRKKELHLWISYEKGLNI